MLLRVMLLGYGSAIRFTTIRSTSDSNHLFGWQFIDSHASSRIRYFPWRKKFSTESDVVDNRPVEGGNKYRHWNGRSWPAVDENEDEMLAERAEYRRPFWMQH